ncbi:hypothetical protein MKX08_009597 [Trichoderma sp. CBMAI-0020]|nr:hypothetical protein MKX08_009597 [Trichoderma sp. CBMAI-0020]
MIYVLYTKAIRTGIRTISTIESASYDTNIKLKFLNFKTSTIVTPAALKTLTINTIDAQTADL